MAQNKTTENDASVDAFLASVENEAQRADALVIRELMGRITGHPARMWGKSLVGFDRYAYRYASGRTGEFFIVGFSPRKRDLTLYIMPGFSAYEDLMARLGKHKTGKSCLYIKRLSDVDMDVLTELITHSVEHMRTKDHGV